ncbi:MAG: diacylglycerol kinase family protein [Ruminococcaceae bacterium]|nr:diacylglycerol kinase family protein [Oscillospiraceae bacterium]
MATAYILFNKLAGNADSLALAKNLETTIPDTAKLLDVTEISDYPAFLARLDKDDYIILAGGDGTLNRFANNVADLDLTHEVLYFPSGTGNDFAHDLGRTTADTPFSVTEHIRNLPSVTVKGNSYRFINGVGYGIDGYCCQVGDEQKKQQNKKVNYTAIAIKGLLFHYKPTTATVTVDGTTTTYKKAWLAPTMNGRFYGGGMMPTPDQVRDCGTLSTMVFHGSGKLKTLIIFPSLFKGAHVKHTKHVAVLNGKEISVAFDRPVALQVDGETILDVSSYTAKAAAVPQASVASIAH